MLNRLHHLILVRLFFLSCAVAWCTGHLLTGVAFADSPALERVENPLRESTANSLPTTTEPDSAVETETVAEPDALPPTGAAQAREVPDGVVPTSELPIAIEVPSVAPTTSAPLGRDRIEQAIKSLQENKTGDPAILAELSSAA